MRLSAKLYGTVGAMAAMGLLAGGVGIAYIRALGEEVREATGATALKLDLVNATRARAWEMVASLRGLYVDGILNDQAGMEASETRWRAAFKRSQEQIRQLHPLLDTGEGRTDLARLESGLSDFGRVATDYIGFCRGRNFERAASLAVQVQGFATLADETLTSLKNNERRLLKASQIRCAALRSQSLSLSVAMSCILLGIVVLAVFVVRGTCHTVGGAIRELSQSAEQVASAAGQVASASQMVAQGASEHAASLEETSASSEEVSSLARRNRDASESAAGLVADSQRRFVETGRSLKDAVAAMSEIGTQSGKISTIVKAIDAIAFQTNILALNAAVEAARAGESGLGFAVVADEVRTLARRSAQAAADTAALIDESIAKSRDGKAKVDQVAVALGAVTEDATRLKTLVDEVNASSIEQAQGTGQIGQAILQMQQITQSTAAGAEQGAAAAQQLSAQSESLKDTMQALVRLVDGGDGAGRPAGSQARPPARPIVALK